MNDRGVLYVCATPIGNLEDVSDRLRRVLSEADLIYAEDTRRTAKLLAHLGVTTATRSLFTGNEKTRTDELVRNVAEGRVVALVSDAGMPTVSDPGAGAITGARASGLSVVVIPGPSAVVTAVAAAGLGGDRFVFEGFLPRKGRERQERLARVSGDDRPVVIFASPHRLVSDLSDLMESAGGTRPITVARELTKLHEEVWAGTLDAALSHWSGRDVKGEITMVLAPGEKIAGSVVDAHALAVSLVEAGAAPSVAAREAAAETGVPRRVIYQKLIEGQERS